MDIDYVNVLSQSTSEEAIDLFDAAIEKVSSVRSSIGAYQNRLEHTISNLDTSQLNMENALSRIEDVDMAEEMTDTQLHQYYNRQEHQFFHRLMNCLRQCFSF